LNITQLRRKEQGAAVCGRDDSGNYVGSQQRHARGQATVAKAEAAKGQTTINQKAVAIAAESVLVAAETAAAMAVAAAMAAVAMAATTQQPWQRWWLRQHGADSGRGGGGCGWRSSFIELSNIICMTVRTDVITIVRRMAKHKSVSIQTKNVFWLAKHICVLQNTFLFCKTHLCFQSVGPVCQIHFRKDTNYLKNEIGFSNIGDFKKIWNRAKTIFLVRVWYW